MTYKKYWRNLTDEEIMKLYNTVKGRCLQNHWNFDIAMDIMLKYMNPAKGRSTPYYNALYFVRHFLPRLLLQAQQRKPDLVPFSHLTKAQQAEVNAYTDGSNPESLMMQKEEEAGLI